MFVVEHHDTDRNTDRSEINILTDDLEQVMRWLTRLTYNVMTNVIKIGERFGRLVVAASAERTHPRKCRWELICDCGERVFKDSQALRSGHTRSCGCLKSELSALRATLHGRSRTPEYTAWSGMKQRCFIPTHNAFSRYGGRGITVAPEWIDDFEAFYSHIGPRPSPKHSLDRIDNDGNYEPGNVRWATSSQQNANRRPRRKRSQI